jgi:hypothetical protein
MTCLSAPDQEDSWHRRCAPWTMEVLGKRGEIMMIQTKLKKKCLRFHTKSKITLAAWTCLCFLATLCISNSSYSSQPQSEPATIGSYSETNLENAFFQLQEQKREERILRRKEYRKRRELMRQTPQLTIEQKKKLALLYILAGGQVRNIAL